MAIYNEGCFFTDTTVMLCYDVQISIDNLLGNYIVDIIDYVHFLTTTHFLYDQVTITEQLLHSLLLHIYTILQLNAFLWLSLH